MNSEKVKEIKKALEDNANYEHHNKLSYIDGYKCKTVDYADILTLINELESENEKFVESCKNCHYIKDLEIANGHAQELKDRIAELEKEVETRKEEVLYLQEYGKKLIRETELKQFAERLKEKFNGYEATYYNGYEEGFHDLQEEIDELLKEYEE